MESFFSFVLGFLSSTAAQSGALFHCASWFGRIFLRSHIFFFLVYLSTFLHDLFRKILEKMGMMVRVCNPSTEEAEAGGL
jgi:hypothetical protein